MRYSHCGVIVRRSLGKQSSTGVSKTALHPRIPGLQVRNRVHTESTARLFGFLPVFVGVVGNISACHADAPGSIPGHGVTLFVSLTLRIIFLVGISNNFYFVLVTNYRGLINYASIAQLAEHLLRKEKVTSSILVGGYLFAWSSWL